jgi:elongation factor G
MRSMFVPAAVMSISVKPKLSTMLANFSKAVGKFSREDPTLRVGIDDKTQQTIMSGMGELHLDIYVERMKREYNVECITGKPSVNFTETILQRSDFNYLHKKQSGGSGQFARVIGYIEPLEEELVKKGVEFQFENAVVGTNIPPELMASCEKGAKAACETGVLAGYPLSGVRVVVTDGQTHVVDSNDLAFQMAMRYGIRAAMNSGKSAVLEPIMALEVSSPSEFQGAIIGNLNKRGGIIMSTDLNDDGSSVLIKADVPLREMFGYSTDLRSGTQGKGEFSMEYKEHQPASRSVQDELMKLFASKMGAEEEE